MEKGCIEPAIYGIQRALHCVVHTVRGENNLLGKRCRQCHLIDVVDAEGRCADCDPRAYKRARLAKQREVGLWLTQAGHDDYIVSDAVVDDGRCGKERPDYMWDCGTHRLVLEVDEDQHRDRQEWCECTRMVNISQSNGMPTVFLRYNPDRYKMAHGTRDPGVLKRRDILMKWLVHLKATVPPTFLSSMQLFFDGYQEGHEELVSVFLGETALP
jgi:hypothetical protein